MTVTIEPVLDEKTEITIETYRGSEVVLEERTLRSQAYSIDSSGSHTITIDSRDPESGELPKFCVVLAFGHGEISMANVQVGSTAIPQVYSYYHNWFGYADGRVQAFRLIDNSGIESASSVTFTANDPPYGAGKVVVYFGYCFGDVSLVDEANGSSIAGVNMWDTFDSGSEEAWNFGVCLTGSPIYVYPNGWTQIDASGSGTGRQGLHGNYGACAGPDAMNGNSGSVTTGFGDHPANPTNMAGQYYIFMLEDSLNEATIVSTGDIEMEVVVQKHADIEVEVDE